MTRPMIEGRHRGWALAALGMLLISTDSFFIRQAESDSWTIACCFGAFSAVALGAVYRVTSDEPPGIAFASAPGPMLTVAALASASQIAFTAAVNNTAVSNVVVIVAATPVFTAVLAWILLRERTERRVVAAIGLTVVGIAIVVSGSVGAPTLDGDLLALLAIVLFSTSMIVWRGHPELNRPLALAASSATMALVAAPFASFGDIDGRVLVAIGLMGLVFNPLGRISYTSATRHAPAAEVALFAPVETVAASAWAWMFFAERPSAQTVVGGVIVIAAVLSGTLGRSRSSFAP